MSKNPPDLWARSMSGFSLLIAIGGLVLGCFNYRWQRAVYEQSQEERVLVLVSAEYKVSNALGSMRTKQPKRIHLSPPCQQTAMRPSGEYARDRLQFV